MSFSSMFIWNTSIMALKLGRLVMSTIRLASAMVLTKLVCIMVTFSRAIITFLGAA